MSQPFVMAAVDRINRRIQEHGWSGITQEERDLANAHAFYCAVANGGIDAVLFNSPYLGDMADELLTSLRRVGAVRAAAIFSEAFGVFPGRCVPQTLDERIAHLRDLKDPDLFAELSERFYKEAEAQEKILLRFLRSHSAVFGPE